MVRLLTVDHTPIRTRISASSYAWRLASWPWSRYCTARSCYYTPKRRAVLPGGTFLTLSVASQLEVNVDLRPLYRDQTVVASHSPLSDQQNRAGFGIHGQ